MMGRTQQQLGTSPPRTPEELLGDLEHPGGPVRLEPFPYAFGSPATGGLYRLVGPDWSWFGKLIQHVRHWPSLQFLPPDVRERFVESFPWRSELELWEEPFLSRLPEGLRAPVLHGLVELGDDRVMVWMEDVDVAATPRDLDEYARAATLLARWNARCSDPELVATNEFPVGYALRMYAREAVAARGIGQLEDDELWAHPWLADHAALRADLRRLAPRIPELLDRLDTFVQTIPHGDASPQNLLIPADDPETFVAIDVSFRTPEPLGFDLGQLLVGLVHAGQVPAAMLPAIAERILTAYVDGLAAEGLTGLDDDVRDAFTTSVLLRSGFDSFLFDLIGSDDPADRHTFDERVALCRFLVDQYLAHHPGD
jgi:hypothetical protein